MDRGRSILAPIIRALPTLPPIYYPLPILNVFGPPLKVGRRIFFSTQ
jgi:hypothetical protein